MSASVGVMTKQIPSGFSGGNPVTWNKPDKWGRAAYLDRAESLIYVQLGYIMCSKCGFITVEVSKCNDKPDFAAKATNESFFSPVGVIPC
jgi:hypothetical protein